MPQPYAESHVQMEGNVLYQTPAIALKIGLELYVPKVSERHISNECAWMNPVP